MKYFKFYDLEGEHIISSREILNTYFPYWSRKLKELGRDNLISEENCIEDFCVVHWAFEILEE